MNGRKVVNLSIISDGMAKRVLSTDELRETLQILQSASPRELVIVNGMAKNVIKVSKISEKDTSSERFRVEVKPMGQVLQENYRAKTRAKSAHLDIKNEVDTSKLVLREVMMRGPYGIVYSGTYKSADVIVKLLDWAEEDTMSRAHLSVLRNAFIEEVNLWSQINHPNVTKFLGASVAHEGYMIPCFQRGKNGEIRVGGNICCLVLEGLSGGSIREFLIQNHKKITLKTSIRIALEFARGLAYLHSKGVIHCDVSTRHAFFDKKGVVKLSDFGSTGNSPLQTDPKRGDVISPEVLDGAKYSEKSDVYGFGFCLWEIFICDVAWTDKHMTHATERCIAPKIPSSLPHKVKNILNQCWKTEQEERASMKEVVQLLEGLNNDLNKKHKSLKELFSHWMARKAEE